MVIAGLDLSKNSPGCVKLTLDSKFNITDVASIGFTTVKKNESDGITFYSKKDFSFDQEQFIFLENTIFKFLEGVEYISLEDYAYGGSGNITDLAEFAGLIKIKQFIEGKKIRVYDIASIKMFATDDGGCDKLSMYQAFLKYKELKSDISKMPIVNKGTGVSPTSDVIDAYWIAELLRLELRLRHAIIKLSDLDEKKIRIFNRVTKAFETNILARDFIQKR